MGGRLRAGVVTVDTHMSGLRRLAGEHVNRSATAGQRSRYLLIVDEAHNMRTEVSADDMMNVMSGGASGGGGSSKKRKADGEGEGEEEQISSKTAACMLHAARGAEYVLLLSGTPVVNCVQDGLNLMAAVRGLDIISAKRMFQEMTKKGAPWAAL